MDKKELNIVCFGEVLWDNLPTGKKPGGAPMNVAYHLKQLGLNSNVISRVGNDANGKELLSVIESLNLSTAYCQIDEAYPTSTVEVHLTEDNEVEYDIVFPAAWDFITFEEEHKALVSKADALVFGSLASRNLQSRETLLKLLAIANYKVFDVNFRAPHFDKDFIKILLEQTDLLKINSSELAEISSWYDASAKTEIDQIAVLNSKLNVKEIILTKGKNGSSFYKNGAVFNCSALKVEVVDTVGSGDSFLAGFLSKYRTGSSIEESLEFASNLAAFVTSSHGACPSYNLNYINDFVKQLLLKVK